MTRSPSHSLILSVFLVLGCGGTDDGGFTDPDARVMGGDAPVDFGPLPTFDIQPFDRGQPQDDTGVRPPLDVVAVDVPSPTDTRPMDSGVTPDSGTIGGVCPPSCATNTDCDSCWRVGEMRVGQYCCSTGLCIYSSSMTCGATMPPPGGGDGGGADGGGGAFDIPEVGLDASGGGG